MCVIKSLKFNGQQDFEKSINRSIYPENTTWLYMSQLLLLGKFEYGGGPIFKVVLECKKNVF